MGESVEASPLESHEASGLEIIRNTIDPGRHFKISPLGRMVDIDVDEDVDDRVLPLDLVGVSDVEIVPESSPGTIPVGGINFFPPSPDAVPETSIYADDSADDDALDLDK